MRLQAVPHGESLGLTHSPLHRKYASNLSNSDLSLEQNDDDAERIERQRSAQIEMRQHEVTCPRLDKRRSIGVSIAGLSAALFAEHYSSCIKLSTENKINVKNAFSSVLIDYMKIILKKEDSKMENFQAEVGDIKTVTAAGRPKMHDVTEEQLQDLMCSAPVLAALQVGLDASRIKLALRRKMEQTGLPFTTPDALIRAVVLILMNDETADTVSCSTSCRETGPLQSSDTDSKEEGQQPIPESKPPLITSCSMPVLSNQQEVPPPEEASTKSMPQLPPTGGGSSKAKDDGVALSLEEEVHRLKEARVCKICMDEELGVVFLPCGHLVTCVNCALSLQDCPICRQLIKATVRTFLA